MDTIYYNGRIKRTKSPQEVFAKMMKTVKKKGPTKKWTCAVDEDGQCLCIDFHDGESEDFLLKFDGKEFNGVCKVAFPLDGELFADGKSEFKALIDVLYAAKSMYSKFEISDDYGLAGTYWNDKKYKCPLRELTADETARVQRLYDAGCHDYQQLLLEIIAEDMGVAADELEKNINPLADTVHRDVLRVQYPKGYYAAPPAIRAILETYIYETMEYQKQGRVCELPYWEYEHKLSKICEYVEAFVLGIEELYGDHDELFWGYSALGARHYQIRLLSKEKLVPALQEENDDLKKCILAYRFFVSVLEYTGFRYVGRIEEPRVRSGPLTPFDAVKEQYGKEKGEVFLQYYCTILKLIVRYPEEERNRRVAELEQNLLNTRGKEFMREFMTFLQSRREDEQFRAQGYYSIACVFEYSGPPLTGLEAF